ncbi:MAG: nuclear transport factor 2 family protein [Bacteroidota bacterium]
MNRLIFIFLFFASFIGTSCAQNLEKQISSVVKTFTQGGDSYDLAKLESSLHADYRMVWHDGQNAQAFIADKTTFVDKVKSKEWGGDSRKVRIEEVHIISEANAYVKATLKGDKADFFSHYTLINSEGKWQIVHELVTAQFK